MVLVGVGLVFGAGVAVEAVVVGAVVLQLVRVLVELPGRGIRVRSALWGSFDSGRASLLGFERWRWI